MLTHCDQDTDDQIAYEVARLGIAHVVLGGHDHAVSCKKFDNRVPLIKLGVDFENITIIDLTAVVSTSVTTPISISQPDDERAWQIVNHVKNDIEGNLTKVIA